MPGGGFSMRAVRTVFVLAAAAWITAAPAHAQPKPEEDKKPIRYVPGKWREFDETTGLVSLMDDQNFQVRRDIIQEKGALYAKLIARKTGDAVTLHIQGGKLVDLELGMDKAKVTLDPKIKKEVDAA